MESGTFAESGNAMDTRFCTSDDCRNSEEACFGRVKMLVYSAFLCRAAISLPCSTLMVSYAGPMKFAYRISANAKKVNERRMLANRFDRYFIGYGSTRCGYLN